MTSRPKVYIAGVGLSPSSSKDSSSKTLSASLVSAAVKALLDAGLTYDSVDRGVVSQQIRDRSAAFKTFDSRDIAVDNADGGSELESSSKLIGDGKSQCVLLIAVEESKTVAIVLVSESLIWRYPYLKDSAVSLGPSNGSGSKKLTSSNKRLQEICRAVWSLRGWSTGSSDGKPSQTYTSASGQVIELNRADKKDIPGWKDVEHKQDGKFRLGYNPARETREIAYEDYEAVTAKGESGHKAKGLRLKRKGGDRAALARL